jgi:amidase
MSEGMSPLEDGAATGPGANGLAYASAVELTGRLRAGELSAEELMRSTLDRIDLVNPGLHAIVTLCRERALSAARDADARRLAGEALGPLHGLPIAHKDLVSTAGIRTTFGSTLFRDNVPGTDDLIVARLREAGAIALGKTNTPEFGAGSQTFNEVFGETRNPYDPSKTCGGSSGGAAVALASGMLPIADGSDMGGSLRNPASFCNVVGFRPSPGRVPDYPKNRAWETLSVLGPMARSVEDCALLLSAMAGPDPRCPISLGDRGERFREPLGRDFEGVRVAWSSDFGGLPVDRRVVGALEAERSVFEDLGCRIDPALPDFSDAHEIFQVLRAWSFFLGFASAGTRVLDQLKDTIVWNIEKGRKLSGEEIGAAEAKRTRLYHRVREFMRDHEFLLLPVSQVPPFEIERRYVPEIEGVAMQSYIDWMKSCYFITLTGHPAISVPCGFTDQGLPVGIQIVGRHNDDFGVLQLAHAFEQANQAGKRRPPGLD